MPSESAPRSARNTHLRGYIVEHLLGRGAFGTVYKAIQSSTGQHVAVKALHLNEGLHPDLLARQRARFRREAQLLARLRHPHIVTLLDTLESDTGILCAIFEFVPGETLADVLARRGAIPPSEAASLMGQVLDALTCAHSQGIIHRDIKPQNVMVTGTGSQPNAKLVDFGIGTFMRIAEVDHSTLTKAGEILGTPAYAAPEQLRGEPATPQSDLYAWGLVLFECLTGAPVMRARNLVHLLHRQLSTTEISLPPGLAAHPLGTLLRRVLQKEPRDRAKGASEVFEELSKLRLDDLVGSFTTAAPPVERTVDVPTEDTMDNWEGPGQPKRLGQITVMSWSLDFNVATDGADPEVIDALARDQLNLSRDTVSKFGGFLAGTLGSRAIAYFGYPHQRDSAARSAALAALELVAETRRRNGGLEPSGLSLDLRIGIHTGPTLMIGHEVPMGQTPNIATRLEARAQPGEILVSDSTRKLLESQIEFAAVEPTPGRSHLPGTSRLLGERSSEFTAFTSLRHLSTALLGRDDELLMLKSSWAQVYGGASKIVLLKGPPGIGKTKLLYELRRAVHGDGHPIHECRCLPEHRNSALHPFIESLRESLELTTISDAEQALQRVESALESCGCKVDGATSILCSWLSISSPEQSASLPHSPQRQRAILFEILQMLLRPPQRGPSLLLIEDLHWADPTTLEFIQHLLQSSAQSSTLAAMTARTEFQPPWESTLLHTHELAPLSRHAACELVRLVAGDRQISAQAVDTIIDRSDGVPLFVEELTGMLLERVLELRDGVYHLPKNFDFTSIPITLLDSLAERLDRMGPAAETARLAAAIGREFSHDLVIAASTRSATATQVDLDLLEQSELIEEQRQGDSTTYTFRHALVRDAAYNSFLRNERCLTHARIAGAIEIKFPDWLNRRPAELARHFAEAEAFDRAATFGARSVVVSLERSAHPEALAQANLTSTWIARLPESEQIAGELQVNGLRTQALMAMKGWADPDVRAAVDRSQMLAGQLDPHKDLRLILPALYHASLHHHVASNRQDCRELALRFDELARASEDSGWQAAGATLLGLALHADGEFREAGSALERALSLYDREAHTHDGNLFGFDSYVWSGATLALVRWFTDGPTAAQACAEDALLWAREIKHLPSLGIALLYQAIIYQYCQDRSSAKRITEEILNLASTYGLPAFEGYAAVIHGWATDSAVAARQILTMLPKMGCRLALHYYGALPADTEARLGDIDAALAQIDDCLALCESIGDKALEPELHRWRANYLLQYTPPRVDDARRAFESAISLSRARGMRQTELLATQALANWHRDNSDATGATMAE